MLASLLEEPACIEMHENSSESPVLHVDPGVSVITISSAVVVVCRAAIEEILLKLCDGRDGDEYVVAH